jgi:hypothetical protein
MHNKYQLKSHIVALPPLPVVENPCLEQSLQSSPGQGSNNDTDQLHG